MQNFMGMDGFIWFTGVVEDRNDPSKLGRVRVRRRTPHGRQRKNTNIRFALGAYHASCDRPIYEWYG